MPIRVERDLDARVPHLVRSALFKAYEFLLILSPFVAGIGLTIIEANHVIHYGRWWNPAVESQATDRTYRIGQTKDVFVYLPILRDPSGRVTPTFDERLDDLMERKQRLAEDFLRPLPPEERPQPDHDLQRRVRRGFTTPLGTARVDETHPPHR